MPVEIIVNALGWTLLHSLWQGAIIGLLFILSCSILRTASPTLRHGNALAWLVLFVALPILTFAGLLMSVNGVEMISSVPAMIPAMPISIWSDGSSNLLPYTLRLLGCLWIAGVLTLLARLWRDWRQLDQFTCAGVKPLPQLEVTLASLCEAMNVRMRVGLVEAGNATVPMVVGFLRPLIVVPSSVLLGLAPRELELIVAHELAHLRRKDHLTNYLIIGAETLFFYHPVVYALTQTIRHERELCCDDLVISTFNERICYAHALSKLETLRGLDVVPASTLRLAAADGPLVVRIARLVKRRTHRRWGVMPAALLPFVAASLAATVFHQTHLAPVDASSPSEASSDSLNAAPLFFDESAITELQRIQLSSYQRRDIAAATVSKITRALTERATSQPLAAIEKGTKKVVDTTSVLTSAATFSSLPKPVASTVRDTASLDSTQALSEEVSPPVSGIAMHPYRSIVGHGQATTKIAGGGTTKAPVSNPVDGSRVAYDMLELSALYALGNRQAGLPASPSYRAQLAANENAQKSTANVSSNTPTTVTGGELIHSVTPRYPTRARSRGLVDKVIVSIEVDATGSVNQVSVVNSDSRPMFQRAVVRAVSKWKFEPLLRNGQPVEQTVEQSFDFRLQPYTARKRSQSCGDTKGDVCSLAS